MSAERAAARSALADGGHRLLMAGGAATLLRRRDPVSRALAAALREAAIGRGSPAERAWLDRLESRRRMLPHDLVSQAPSDDRVPEPPRRTTGSPARSGSAACSASRAPGDGSCSSWSRRLRPGSCLEIGTGFGVSTSYQAAALALNGRGSLISVDTGEHARAAELNLSVLGIADRATVVIDRPVVGLRRALELGERFDLALLDADHTEEGTIRDFDAIEPHLAPGAVVVIDDISWTGGMRTCLGGDPLGSIGSIMALGLRRFGIVTIRSGARVVSPAKGIAARIPPDAAATNLAHRALLGARAPRLAGRADHASRALARAMRATALGRGNPAELAWLARIDQRRRELFEGSAHADAGLWAPEAAWSIPRIWGGFLLRLVVALGPRSSLELGAGFGLSGCYQAAGLAINGAGRLRTLDQEPSLIPRARESYAALGLDHLIELTAGPIGETLAPVAAAVAPIDFALIDAEHTEDATVFNFDGVRPDLAPGAVVLIDDIRSTAEMRRALGDDPLAPGNALTLDLRRIGVVSVEGPARR